MSNFVLFPGPFLYITKVSNHSEIKDSIVSFIKDHARGEIDSPVEKAYSSYYNDENQFSDFMITNSFLTDIIWDPMDSMLRQMPFEIRSPVNNSNVTELWYQYYKTGGHHKEHTHSNCTFSGIYILHSTEPNKTIFFGNGAANQGYQRFTHDTHYLTEGHVILFPSEMYHKVMPNEHERMVISFNIKSR